MNLTERFEQMTREQIVVELNQAVVALAHHGPIAILSFMGRYEPHFVKDYTLPDSAVAHGSFGAKEVIDTALEVLRRHDQRSGAMWALGQVVDSATSTDDPKVALKYVKGFVGECLTGGRLHHEFGLSEEEPRP